MHNGDMAWLPGTNELDQSAGLSIGSFSMCARGTITPGGVETSDVPFTWDVTVASNNSPPVFGATATDAQTVEAETDLTIDFGALVTDPDVADVHTFTGQILAPTAGAFPGIMTLVPGTGVFTLSGTTNTDVNAYTVEITATDDDTDGGGAVLKSATISFILTITELNKAPVCAAIVPLTTTYNAFDVITGNTLVTSSTDANAGDTRVFIVKYSNESSAPSWISANALGTKIDFTGTLTNA